MISSLILFLKYIHFNIFIIMPSGLIKFIGNLNITPVIEHSELLGFSIFIILSIVVLIKLFKKTLF